METASTANGEQPDLTAGAILSETLGYVVGIASALFAVQSLKRALEQQGNEDLPNQLLGVGDLSEALRRGYIDDDRFAAELLRDGINSEKAQWLASLTVPLLAVGDLLVSWKRGIIDEDTFSKGIKQLGYNDAQIAVLIGNYDEKLGAEDVVQAELRGYSSVGGPVDYSPDPISKGLTLDRLQLFRDLAKHLASLADMENFAAWNLTDPAFVTALDLDAEMPADYIANAAKLGISSELATSYWRSHWEAPPIFIVKGLFQTGQITETQLMQMLSSYQIPPIFRQSIIDAFYKQPSEGQIKKMLAEGIITAADVPKLYAGLGYSPDQITNLSKLLIADVNNPAAAEKTAKAAQKELYYGLSSGNVIDSYIDQIITRDQASTYLADLGDPSDIAEIKLSLADHKIATNAQKDEIEVAHDQYVSGYIALTDAQQLLVQAGCTENQVAHYTYKWSLEVQKLIKQPSKADLDAFLKKNIIDQPTYRSQMESIGYADEWIDNYILLVTGEPVAPTV